MNQTFKALRQLLMVLGILAVMSISLVSEGAEVVHQEIKISLYPMLNKIEAETTVTLPYSAGKKTSFLLNKNLTPVILSAGDTLKLIQTGGKDEPSNLWGVQLGSNDQKFRISYQGQINDPVTAQGTYGFVSSDGVLLWGSTYWHPTFVGSLYSFQLEVNGPDRWSYINQGQLTQKSRSGHQFTLQYSERKPQEEIYLIAGSFFQYEVKTKSGLPIRVLLKKDQPDLAQSYLALIPDFIDHYTQTLGPYPYSHFSVVENWWETGYGMPGFTLLGPTVIRLPFILSSSLPHEVLHNWFGNSVYIDYEKGNWAEGLTTYLSDYWQQELQGLAKDYRLSQLLAYTDFASEGKDFPLSQFKGRHNSASQAVGYSKAMMVFHMLKSQLGKKAFEEGLKNFYVQNLYKQVSWAELQQSFEEVSNVSLDGFFQQWIKRSGAPELQLVSATHSEWLIGIHAVELTLRQNQTELYDLSIPVRWTLSNGQTFWSRLKLNQRQQTYHSSFSEPPVLVEVDPEFEVFRKLAPQERPASLSQIFSASEVQVFYTKESAFLQEILKPWSEKFGNRFMSEEVTDQLIYSTRNPIVLLGDYDLFYDFMRKHGASPNELAASATQIQLLGSEYARKNHSFVISISSAINPGQTVTWIVSDGMGDLNRWGTRLTHYSKYGALVFEKERNVLKSSMTPLGSPLRRTPMVVSDFISQSRR